MGFQKTGLKCCKIVALLFLLCLVYIIVYIKINFNTTGYHITILPKSFVALHSLIAPSSNKKATLLKNNKNNSRTVYTHKIDKLYNLTIGKPVKRINVNVTGKTHTILFYNMLYYFNEHIINGVLQSEDCAYRNCRITTNRHEIMRSSAVLFWFERLEYYPPVTPSNRTKDQVWVFYGLEPPTNHNYRPFRYSAWRNTMNWSMTYRLDSDIPMPYGYLKLRQNVPTKDYSAIYRSKTKLVAWFVSNCGAPSFRDEYVTEMEREGITVDKFGWCSEDLFHNRHDLEERLNRDYMFYLSFENSLCKDYVTEKYFRNLKLDVVLVVRGGADYDKLLPNDTFINTDKFQSAKKLVAYMRHISSNEIEYTRYLRNSDKYDVLEDYQNRNTYTWCHLCEKLNNLEDNRKTYADMADFLGDGNCEVAKDISVVWFFKLPCLIISIIMMVVILIACVYKYCIVHRTCCVTCSNCCGKRTS